MSSLANALVMSSSANASRPAPIQTDFINSVNQCLEKAGQPGEPYLEVKCGVCWRLLDISTVVGDWIREDVAKVVGAPPETKEKFYEEHQLERTVVLHCGHLIGRECFEGFVKDVDFSARFCVFCKADNLCHGCPSNALWDYGFDPVPWPLDPAQFKPYEAFQSQVGLTRVEKDPETKRFCEICAVWQIRRKFAELFLTFPRCQFCQDGEQRSGGAAAAAPTFRHEEWRDANVDSWLHQKVAEICRLIYPSAADVRDPGEAPLLESQMRMERAKLQAAMLAEPAIAALRRVAFRPCQQDDEDFLRRNRLTQRETFEVLELVRECSLLFWDQTSARLPVGWYRGDEEFLAYAPAHQVYIGEQLSAEERLAVENALMLVGAEAVLGAVRKVNPHVTMSLYDIALSQDF